MSKAPIFLIEKRKPVVEHALLQAQGDGNGFSAEHIFEIAEAAEKRLTEIFRTNRGAYRGARVQAYSRNKHRFQDRPLAFSAKLERHLHGWCLVSIEAIHPHGIPAGWWLHLTSAQARTALHHLAYRAGFLLPPKIDGEIRPLPREAFRISAIERGEA